MICEAINNKAQRMAEQNKMKCQKDEIEKVKANAKQSTIRELKKSVGRLSRGK